MVKHCPRCKTNKPLSEFNKFQGWCTPCKKVYNKEYNKNLSFETRKGYKLKEYYGMTLEEYNIILKSQNHSCAICGIHESKCNRKLAVDHNHRCGSIRALLCDYCNRGLGFFQDSYLILEKAAKYLKESSDGNKILATSRRSTKMGA